MNNQVYALRGDRSTDFWKYLVASNTWTSLTATPANVRAGGALTTDGADIFALRGDDNRNFWKYDVVGDVWTSLENTPNDVNEGGSLIFLNGDVYALRGDNTDDFWKFAVPVVPAWRILPNTPAIVGEGGSLTSDAANLYALGGDKKKDFWEFDLLSLGWSSLTDTPETVGNGSALAYANGFVYALIGGDDGGSFWRFKFGPRDLGASGRPTRRSWRRWSFGLGRRRPPLCFPRQWRRRQVLAVPDIRQRLDQRQQPGQRRWRRRGLNPFYPGRFTRFEAPTSGTSGNIPLPPALGAFCPTYPKTCSKGALSLPTAPTSLPCGGQGKGLWKFDISDNSWLLFPVTPKDVKQGRVLGVSHRRNYALRGDLSQDFWKFTLSLRRRTHPNPVPPTPTLTPTPVPVPSAVNWNSLASVLGDVKGGGSWPPTGPTSMPSVAMARGTSGGTTQLPISGARWRMPGKCACRRRFGFYHRVYLCLPWR